MVARALRSTAIAAVNFFAKRVGYTTPTDSQFWLGELRKEAMNSFIPESKVQDFFRKNMTANFNRFVTRGGFKKWNPGIETSEIKRLDPILQAELNKRITFACQMVEVNRKKAMEELASRFTGWASSVPATGNIVEQKNTIRAKILAPLKYSAANERRILRDQNNKLTSALNSVISMNRGAIAAVWHSRWKDPGYNYREDHKERDEKLYSIRNSWAQEQGFVYSSDNGYTDEITQPCEEINCKCHYTFIYRLQELPAQMLTDKGVERVLGANLDGAA